MPTNMFVSIEVGEAVEHPPICSLDVPYNVILDSFHTSAYSTRVTTRHSGNAHSIHPFKVLLHSIRVQTTLEKNERDFASAQSELVQIRPFIDVIESHARFDVNDHFDDTY